MAKVKRNKGKKKKGKDPVPTINEEELRQKAYESGRRTIEEGYRYGDELANKYLPDGTFEKIDVNPTQQMSDYLAALRQRAATANEYTPLEMEALANLRAGLGGYTAPELQAQRELMGQQINQDLATQLRLQNLAAARNRVRGAAAMAQQGDLQQGAQRSLAQVNRDIFIKNADEIQSRRAAFGNLVGGTEANRNQRSLGYEQQLGGTMGLLEQLRQSGSIFNAGQSGNEALGKSAIASGAAGAFAGLVGGEQGLGLGINEANQAAQAQRDYMQQQNKLLAQQRDAINKQFSSLAGMVG